MGRGEWGGGEGIEHYVKVMGFKGFFFVSSTFASSVGNKGLDEGVVGAEGERTGLYFSF